MSQIERKPDGNAVRLAAVRRNLRPLLMSAVPVLLLVVGGGYWLLGGRYVATDNAYIQQDKVLVSGDVPGRIAEVAVRENEAVDAGQLLFRIDPEPYALRLRAAEAAIAGARLHVEQLRDAYAQSEVTVHGAEETLAYRQSEFARQQALSQGGYTAQAKYDEARHLLLEARQELDRARQGMAGARGQLAGDPAIATDEHPLVLEAIAHRDQARLDLEHTAIVAPVAGVVSQADRLQIGQYVALGTPVLGLVASGAVWVEANVKETDLAHLAIGQPATVGVDAYPDLVWTAHIDSIGAGTGAEFSLLPAQNATGNWVKVVQRVPIRLRLDVVEDGPALRAGLSATVSIDTGMRTGTALFRKALALIGIGAGTPPAN